LGVVGGWDNLDFPASMSVMKPCSVLVLY
jgi:hypothetical protein